MKKPKRKPTKPASNKLTFEQAEEMRRRHAAGEGAYVLAREYGVSPVAVYAILEGRIHAAPPGRTRMLHIRISVEAYARALSSRGETHEQLLRRASEILERYLPGGSDGRVLGGQ